MQFNLINLLFSFIWILPKFIKAIIQSKWNSYLIQKLKAERFTVKEQRKQLNLHYDPQNCPSFHRFRLLAKKSDCLFAKTANIWGCVEYDEERTLKENIQTLIPSLIKFVTLADDGEKLDGYVIEIKEKSLFQDVESFTKTVKQTLEIISEADPVGLNVMKLKSISSSSWYFSFCNVPIFVTTFAPFYSSSHCRYTHSIPELENICYILLQPEISFLQNNIGSDLPTTNWDNPESIRDRIRCNFKKHGRGYYIPPTNRYPVAEMIVLDPHSNDEKFEPIKLWK